MDLANTPLISRNSSSNQTSDLEFVINQKPSMGVLLAEDVVVSTTHKSQRLSKAKVVESNSSL